MSAVRENCFASPELCLSLCRRDASGRLAYRLKVGICPHPKRRVVYQQLGLHMGFFAHPNGYSPELRCWYALRGDQARASPAINMCS